LNNYSAAEIEQLKAHECRYMALGFHVGVKSKLPHVHIALEYKSVRVMPKFNKRIHWDERKGTLRQALDYLNKEDKLEERGDRPRLDQKIATTFEDMYEDAKQGIIHPQTMIYVRYRNYFDNLANAAQLPYTWDGELNTKNLWLWGPAGTGKSSFVVNAARAEGKTVYKKRKNKWWDGYVGQDYVLIEDIDPKDCEFLTSMIKEWADRQDFLGEVKGGTIRIEPRYRLVITSNHSMVKCFPDEADLEALERRFEIWHLTKRVGQVAAPPRPANPTPPSTQTYESQTEGAQNISSSWN